MGNGAFRLVGLLAMGAGPTLLPACNSTSSPGSTVSSGNTVVAQGGFATSCSTNDDCVGAYFGDVCGFCSAGLPNAAIASSAEGAYQNAVNAAESHCPPNMVTGSCVSNQTITTCATGTCTLTTCPGTPASAHACASTDDGGDSGSDAGTNDAGSTVVTGDGFATSCSTDDDCVGVYFGDVCGVCATLLPNAAIASSAEGAYQNAVNAAESRCPPIMGGGSCRASQTITTCAMGACTLATCPGAPAGAHACASTDSGSVRGSDSGIRD